MDHELIRKFLIDPITDASNTHIKEAVGERLYRGVRVLFHQYADRPLVNIDRVTTTLLRQLDAEQIMWRDWGDRAW